MLTLFLYPACHKINTVDYDRIAHQKLVSLIVVLVGIWGLIHLMVHQVIYTDSNRENLLLFCCLLLSSTVRI